MRSEEKDIIYMDKHRKMMIKVANPGTKKKAGDKEVLT